MYLNAQCLYDARPDLVYGGLTLLHFCLFLAKIKTKNVYLEMRERESEREKRAIC